MGKFGVRYAEGRVGAYVVFPVQPGPDVLLGLVSYHLCSGDTHWWFVVRDESGRRAGQAVLHCEMRARQHQGLTCSRFDC